jgi:hypothetical protein
MPDFSSGWQEINSKVDSLSTYNELSKNSKELKKNKGNSLEGLLGDSATQLNKVKDLQKRFQKEAPTSMDQI